MGEIIQFPRASQPERSQDIEIFITITDERDFEHQLGTKPPSKWGDWLFGACLGWWLGA